MSLRGRMATVVIVRDRSDEKLDLWEVSKVDGGCQCLLCEPWCLVEPRARLHSCPSSPLSEDYR